MILKDSLVAMVSLLKNIGAQKDGRPHLGLWRHYSKLLHLSQDTIEALAYYNETNRVPFWANKQVRALVRHIDYLFSRCVHTSFER